MGENQFAILAELLSPMTLFTEVILAVACLSGDLILQEPEVTRNAVLKAVIDSSTHGLAGLLSWAVISGVSCRRHVVQEILICGFFAVIIDVDHFIAARSFRLKDATSLTHRPPLHSSTVIPVVILLTYLLSRIVTLPSQNSLPWIVLVAFLSHHLRDANRRGLWFWPLGATPALPRILYIILVMLLPMVVRLVHLLSSRAKPVADLPILDV